MEGWIHEIILEEFNFLVFFFGGGLTNEAVLNRAIAGLRQIQNGRISCDFLGAL